LKNPKDLNKAVEDLIHKNLQLTKEIEQLQLEKAKIVKSELKAKITTINGINFIGELADVDTNSVKDILFQLKGETENFVGILGNADGDKCALSLIISDNLVEDKKWNASQIIREVSTHIQGGGGGQAFFATAGGKKSEGLKTAIEEVKSRLN
jgi:alanyl-tRNA synthetase